MLEKYIVLFQTKENGWIAYPTTLDDANRMLNVNINHDIFYIFECDVLQQFPYTMKLQFPFYKYYNSRKIIKYKEESSSENLIVSYKNNNTSTYYNVTINVKHTHPIITNNEIPLRLIARL